MKLALIGGAGVRTCDCSCEQNPSQETAHHTPDRFASFIGSSNLSRERYYDLRCYGSDTHCKACCIKPNQCLRRRQENQRQKGREQKHRDQLPFFIDIPQGDKQKHTYGKTNLSKHGNDPRMLIIHTECSPHIS